MSADPELDPAYRALILSDRVSSRTRDALLERAAADDPAYVPAVLSAAEVATLRSVFARVLPQQGTAIDLAARFDRALASGTGDGWRYADLPPDQAACRTGLAVLDALANGTHGQPFVALGEAAQDRVLDEAAGGRAALGEGHWTGQQLQRWFEDLRAEVVKLYVAHPATMARIGYSGIGYGGDAPRLPGFHAIEPGDREPWEPLPARAAAR